MCSKCACLCVSAFLWHDWGSREFLFLSLTNDDAFDADDAVFLCPFLTHLSPLSYLCISMFLFLSEFMPLQLSIDFRVAPTTDWG